MTAMLEAALAYAARGWPVFPCWPGRKNPVTASGVLDATTDAAQIRAWWTARPDCNIAIATGAPGPDVADFDTGDDGRGFTALATLTTAGLIEGHGMMTETRSGGLHVYFAGTSQRNSTLRSKHLANPAPVDFRAAGGYVLAPPSYVEADDKRAGHYKILSPGAGQPGFIDWRIARDVVRPPPPFRQPAAEKAALTGDRERAGDDYAARTSWPQILAPHGWRQIRQAGNARYWCRPGKTGRFISASTRDDGGLWVFSTSTEFDADTMYSKFGACAVLEHGGDYKAAAAALRRDGFGTQPPASVPAGFQQPAAEPDSADNWWTPIVERHQLVDWQQLWDDTPEDEDWIIKPVIAAGRSIALYSPPKTGKSLLVLEMAAAIATGGPVLGQPAGRPRRVLYVDLENSRRDLRDRLTDFGYKPADLGNLAYLSFPSLPALDSPHGGLEILALAIAYDVELVIIDTVSRVISGGENDADTFAALYRHALAPLKGRGIAVIRIDHSGKDAGKGQRGSSAKNADVDAVWILTAAGPILTLRCEMSRTAIEAPSISLRRETGPLRHVITEHAAAAVDRVQDVIAKLDELGVPRDWGGVRCLRALNGAAFPVDKNVLPEAIRVRKMTIKLPDSDSEETGDVTYLKDHQAGNAKSAESAGQTCLKDHQAGTGRPFQGVQAQPAWSDTPVGGGAQAGAGAADSRHPHPDYRCCTSCGEDHPPGQPCYTPPGKMP